MGCREHLSLSVVQLKGKNCRKPHWHNGVVSSFRPCLLVLWVYLVTILNTLVSCISPSKRLLPWILHSPSKCLALVKKCHRVCLDQNFDPSLLTNKLWLVFMGKKQKKIKKNFEKINSKWPLKKSNVFQNRQFSIFLMKILWIGPWISRIDCC